MKNKYFITSDGNYIKVIDTILENDRCLYKYITLRDDAFTIDSEYPEFWDKIYLVYQDISENTMDELLSTAQEITEEEFVNYYTAALLKYIL